jgi:hypothetical protein
MKTSEQINEIAKAISIAQGQIQPASKDSINPHFRSKFSSLSAVWETIREPLKNNELTVWQDVTTHEKGVSVETKIVHSSGQWVEFGPLIMPVGRADPQSIGSATSYAKRYALCAALGVVSSDEDDDANNAMPKDNQNPQKEAMISSAQLKYLLSLTDKDTQDKMLSFYKIEDLSELTISQAKACIDKAKGSVKNG